MGSQDTLTLLCACVHKSLDAHPKDHLIKCGESGRMYFPSPIPPSYSNMALSLRRFRPMRNCRMGSRLQANPLICFKCRRLIMFSLLMSRLLSLDFIYSTATFDLIFKYISINLVEICCLVTPTPITVHAWDWFEDELAQPWCYAPYLRLLLVSWWLSKESHQTLTWGS